MLFQVDIFLRERGNSQKYELYLQRYLRTTGLGQFVSDTLREILPAISMKSEITRRGFRTNLLREIAE